MDDLSVCASVCPVHCGKTADRIRMPFGITGRTGPGMSQVMGFGSRSTGTGTFGANLWRAIVTSGDLLLQRRSPLHKLLWADLLYIAAIVFVIKFHTILCKFARLHIRRLN